MSEEKVSEKEGYTKSVYDLNMLAFGNGMEMYRSYMRALANTAELYSSWISSPFTQNMISIYRTAFDTFFETVKPFFAAAERSKKRLYDKSD